MFARHVLAGRLCGRRLQSALTAVISSYFASPYIVGTDAPKIPCCLGIWSVDLAARDKSNAILIGCSNSRVHTVGSAKRIASPVLRYQQHRRPFYADYRLPSNIQSVGAMHAPAHCSFDPAATQH
jgi:hypothetical protein